MIEQEKRPRGRPRKNPVSDVPVEKRPRGRPKKPEPVAGSPEELEAFARAFKHYQAVRKANKDYYERNKEKIRSKSRAKESEGI